MTRAVPALQQAIAKATGQSGGPRVPVRARAVQKPPGQMNGLESRYAQRLELRRRAHDIASWRYEPMTLKLAEGVRYTPDFLVITNEGEMEFHECKGQILPEGRVKLHTAAALFPEFRFLLVKAAGTRDHPDFSVVEVGR